MAFSILAHPPLLLCTKQFQCSTNQIEQCNPASSTKYQITKRIERKERWRWICCREGAPKESTVGATSWIRDLERKKKESPIKRRKIGIGSNGSDNHNELKEEQRDWILKEEIQHCQEQQHRFKARHNL